MSSVFKRGRIVWADLPDTQGGNPKSRPAVVVSDEREQADGFVRVVALTTLTGRARFEETVLIPAAMQELTTLKRECEAVCSWVVRVPLTDVRATDGELPTELTTEIIEKVELYS